MEILKKLDGYKTYIAAAGLFGLSLFQVSQGQFETAIQSFMGGLAAIGVRHAVTKNAEEQKNLIRLARDKNMDFGAYLRSEGYDVG